MYLCEAFRSISRIHQHAHRYSQWSQSVSRMRLSAQESSRHSSTVSFCFFLRQSPRFESSSRLCLCSSTDIPTIQCPNFTYLKHLIDDISFSLIVSDKLREPCIIHLYWYRMLLLRPAESWILLNLPSTWYPTHLFPWPSARISPVAPSLSLSPGAPFVFSCAANLSSDTSGCPGRQFENYGKLIWLFGHSALR